MLQKKDTEYLVWVPNNIARLLQITRRAGTGHGCACSPDAREVGDGQPVGDADLIAMDFAISRGKPRVTTTADKSAEHRRI
jgi:hypothetical protein